MPTRKKEAVQEFWGPYERKYPETRAVKSRWHQLIKASGKGQNEAAREAGMDPGAFSRVIGGTRKLNDDAGEHVALAAALHCDLDAISWAMGRILPRSKRTHASANRAIEADGSVAKDDLPETEYVPWPKSGVELEAYVSAWPTADSAIYVDKDTPPTVGELGLVKFKGGPVRGKLAYAARGSNRWSLSLLNLDGSVLKSDAEITSFKPVVWILTRK